MGKRRGNRPEFFIEEMNQVVSIKHIPTAAEALETINSILSRSCTAIMPDHFLILLKKDEAQLQVMRAEVEKLLLSAEKSRAENLEHIYEDVFKHLDAVKDRYLIEALKKSGYLTDQLEMPDTVRLCIEIEKPTPTLDVSLI